MQHKTLTNMDGCSKIMIKQTRSPSIPKY